MKKWLLIGLGLLLVLCAIVTGIGAMLPVSHTATSTAHFDQPPEAIWEAISDFEAGPSWRAGIDSVERLPDREGRPVWRENGDYGPMAIEIVESDPPRRMVTRIADPELPFGGMWTYEISPADGGTRLTITEDGEVYNIVFRFMSRFVFGHTSTMETYLVDLGRKFGEEVVPTSPAESSG